MYMKKGKNMEGLEKEIKEQTKEKMEEVLKSFSQRLAKVRTGRATVSMLDGVKVDSYGQLSPLSQVASVSCPDAQSFLIKPWDATLLKAIETGIVKSLELAPVNDGKVIRVRVPELTEDRRNELVRSIQKMSEESKVSVRQVRKTSNETVKVAEKEKKISENESHFFQEEVQKITDEHIKKLDELGEKKKQDILTI